ncbi:MAG: DUF2378 family protein [Archangiaceae bacterium]|nr:DUF2378 family protein [Archangiaceae bacterium]
MSEKLIFAQTIEGLLRGMGQLNEQDKTQLRALGIDVDKRLLPAYPLDQFVAALDFAGARLAPNAPRDEQNLLIGRRFMDSYQETMVGRAMVAGLRVIGPWRTLERLSNKFRTGNNFSDTRLSRLGDAEAELWCNQVSRPGWYMGIIGRGLELAGAKDVQVSLISAGSTSDLGPPSDDTGARFSVRWK